MVATDAWHPQISGVVRTLEALASAVRTLGSTIDFLTPDGFATLPLPTYPGLRCALPSPAEIARRIQLVAPGRDPCRHRRSNWVHGPASLPEAGSAVHHQFHDTVSGIYRRSCPTACQLGLCRTAAFSRRCGCDHGLDPDARRRTHRARLCTPENVEPWRRQPAVSAPSSAAVRHGRARFS